MTLPYLKGWGDTLAEQGGQIGQNIAHIINPNIEFQKLFKAAVAKDPTILQQIANNPGLADALKKSGIGDISQQTSGLQVDPTVAAQRTILGANADIAKGTVGAKITEANAGATSAASKARVDTATEGDVITTAKNQATITGNQAKLSGTAADKAQRDFDLASQTLAKIPTLAGIDLQKVGNAIVRGDQSVSAELLSRIGMDEGSSNALKLFTQAAINRADNAAQMSIAQLRKKDPSFQLAALSGLEKQIDDITNQIKAANNTLAATKPKDLALIRIQSNSKDPDIAGPAKQTLKQYEEALKVVNDHGPGSLTAQWTEANAKRSIILGGLSGAPTNMGGGETSVTVKTPSATSNDPMTIAKEAYRTGKATAADIQNAVKDGSITAQQAAEIMNTKTNNMNDTLNNLIKLPEKKKMKVKIPGIVSDR